MGYAITNSQMQYDASDKEMDKKKINVEYRDHTCFSCINICRVPRMLLEHEADRLF